jgi:hypothetical protein
MKNIFSKVPLKVLRLEIYSPCSSNIEEYWVPKTMYSYFDFFYIQPDITEY